RRARRPDPDDPLCGQPRQARPPGPPGGSMGGGARGEAGPPCQGPALNRGTEPSRAVTSVTMTPQVTPLDPKTASDADLADYHALRVALLTVDMPEELLPSRETSVGYLRTPIHPDSDAAYW